MPPKKYVAFPKYEGDFRVMPAYIESLEAAGVKIVNVHPNNPEKYGLPTVMATILLLDPKTGKPIAIMDGTWITNMRTGAAGGIAANIWTAILHRSGDYFFTAIITEYGLRSCFKRRVNTSGLCPIRS
jgi:ornithine cyclodeaminase/alanine dehydrogenase-like protein (mu-crystallin family)